MTTYQLPFRQLNPVRLAPTVRTLQSQGGVHRIRTAVGHEAWLVTDYLHVRSLFDDERLGRSHPRPETAARTGESALFGGPVGNYDTEAADHARMRSLLQPHFTPKHMRALLPRVEALTAELLDRLAEQRPPADLHTALALPLPILVICELLGVPYADRDQFRQWSQDAGNVRDPNRSQRGLAELYRYGMTMVEHKRAHPGDDIISRLCATDGVTADEVATLSMSLLFAGHETTVVQIGLQTVVLLTNPDLWRTLLEDPTLIPHAVEELLRMTAFGGGVGGMPRYARTDLDIDGVQIHAGDLVLLDMGAANHDPGVFPESDHPDLARKHAPHVTFGYGARYCIGAPLARVELKTVISQLIPRFPTLHLTADPTTLARRDDVLAGGLTELPVSW